MVSVMWSQLVARVLGGCYHVPIGCKGVAGGCYANPVDCYCVSWGGYYAIPAGC